MDHTIVEKKIKRDIVLKNTILKKIQRMNAQVTRWQARAEATGNRRWQKKYRATIRRFLEEIYRLQPGARKMIDDLDDRIQEELNFSRQEVQTFQKDLAEEKTRMDKVTGDLEAVERKLKEEDQLLKTITDESGTQARKLKEQLKKDQARARRLKRKGEQEARQVEKLEGELKSEAVDKKILTEELRRIEKEKKMIASTPEKEEEAAPPE